MSEAQVAIVTGSSRGIGKDVAILLAQRGFTVVLSGTNEERLKDVAESLRNETDSIVDYYALDISQASQVESFIEDVLKKYGCIDVLVNNAGITADNLLLRMSEKEWDDVIDINLKGVFLCSKAVLKPMMKARKGSIINVSSVVGVIGNPGQTNYAASKAGIIGFSKSLAREVASRNISVNVVAPGYIETDMTSVLPEKVIQNALSSIPQNRLGKPKDVAELILFLTSEASSYITGQVIHVDGGLAM